MKKVQLIELINFTLVLAIFLVLFINFRRVCAPHQFFLLVCFVCSNIIRMPIDKEVNIVNYVCWCFWSIKIKHCHIWSFPYSFPKKLTLISFLSDDIYTLIIFHTPKHFKKHYNIFFFFVKELVSCLFSMLLLSLLTLSLSANLLYFNFFL